MNRLRHAAAFHIKPSAECVTDRNALWLNFVLADVGNSFVVNVTYTNRMAEKVLVVGKEKQNTLGLSHSRHSTPL